MQIFYIVSFIIITAINLFLAYALSRYRRMFIDQEENFMRMYRLVDRYEEKYNALREDKK